MDSSSAAAECVTLMAAGGAVIHTFPTGQGNVVGNPIVPVIKITANPRTVRTMGEHVDVDVSGILRREMTIDEAGDALIDMIRRTANGRNTAAEALGHREFSMTKLYRSASPRSTPPTRRACRWRASWASRSMAVGNSHHCGALSVQVERYRRGGLIGSWWPTRPRPSRHGGRASRSSAPTPSPSPRPSPVPRRW
jgi:hypothetical protein